VAISALYDALDRVIRGKHETLELVLTAIVAGGHLLLEDVPGTGKTSLARAIAASIGTEGEGVVFRRIQFTPDLLPYDLTGVDIYDPGRRRFRFAPGPVFAHVILADEINRATPKVQSALLEVMNERQVTVGGRTYPMDELFLVVATENPVTMEGTYPLPLAELDRFIMRLSLGYPDEQAELEILRDDPGRRILPALTPVIGRAEILELQAKARDLYCHPDLERAAVAISASTRSDRPLAYRSAPRATLHLLDAMRALALVRGREYVTDAELERLAAPVLAHRLRPAEPDVDPAALVQERCAREIATLQRESWSRHGAPT